MKTCNKVLVGIPPTEDTSQKFYQSGIRVCWIITIQVLTTGVTGMTSALASFGVSIQGWRQGRACRAIAPHVGGI